MPDDNDDDGNSRDDLSDGMPRSNLNPLMENHLSKMRYLDKQINHSLKWNRRWFTAQFLEDHHDNDVKVQIYWHKNHNSEVLNSIPMVAIIVPV